MPELIKKEGMHGPVLDIRFEDKSHASDIVPFALLQSMTDALYPKPVFQSAFQVSSPAGMGSQLWPSLSAMVPVLP